MTDSLVLVQMFAVDAQPGNRGAVTRCIVAGLAVGWAVTMLLCGAEVLLQ